ncbi:unnamed protein product [Clonostachys solani]|uniref:Uncharacterized protein n=1 Tax=Clonostachys solani TaxID=160281 RepID=A0A9N9Z6X5_9HYPO|nr:unnamed protein product [Clonostachys solani]
MAESKKTEDVELSIMKPPSTTSADSPKPSADTEDESSAEQPAKAQGFVLPRFDFERPQRFMDPERYLIEIIQQVQDDDAEMDEEEPDETDDKSSSSDNPSDEEPSNDKPPDEKLPDEKTSDEKISDEETSDEKASDEKISEK